MKFSLRYITDVTGITPEKVVLGTRFRAALPDSTLAGDQDRIVWWEVIAVMGGITEAKRADTGEST